MLHSRHYQLDSTRVPWDIAHVYEHLVILGAKKYLRDHGINQDLFGWVTGTTFENRLFIDAVFYHERSAEVFDTYMTGGISVSRQGVEDAVSTVEAEEKSRFVGNKGILIEPLRCLSRQKWNTEVTAENGVQTSGVLFRSAAASFRDVSISIGAEGLSSEEQKIFLRLRPMLQDIVSNYLSHDVVLYERGASSMFKDDNSSDMHFIVVATTRGLSGSLVRMADDLRHHLVEYPIKELWGDFQAHFGAFAGEPLWKSAATEYYRTTGIITTPKEIAGLASVARSQKVFSMLQVRMHTTTSEEREMLDT